MTVTGGTPKDARGGGDPLSNNLATSRGEEESFDGFMETWRF